MTAMTMGVFLLVSPAMVLAADAAKAAVGVEMQKSVMGDGSVAVMNNGAVIVYINGADTFILQSSADVTRHGLLWDRRNGWHIGEVRGSSRAKKSLAFTEADTYDLAPLLKLGGTVSVEIRMEESPTISVHVQAKSGEMFSHEFWLDEEMSPLSPQYGVSGSVAGGESGASCSAYCINGNGTVTCPPKVGCYAYCDRGGIPQVGCGKRVRVMY